MNQVEGLYWDHQANQANNAEAQYKLGRMYERGLQVEKNIDLALAWYEKATQQDNAKAYYRLGNLAGKEDFNYIEKAANLGHKIAQYQ